MLIRPEQLPRRPNLSALDIAHADHRKPTGVSALLFTTPKPRRLAAMQMNAEPKSTRALLLRQVVGAVLSPSHACYHHVGLNITSISPAKPYRAPVAVCSPWLTMRERR
jgi:hypothetical protein